MPDLKSTLDRGLRGFTPSTEALERTLERVDRRRRRRRIAAGAVAIVIVAAAFGSALSILRSAERERPVGQVSPSPKARHSPSGHISAKAITAPTVVALDGSIVRTIDGLPRDASDFDVSPTGSQVAFGVRSSGVSRIGTMSLDGSDLRYLTPPSVNAVEPAWSPDGSLIAYAVRPAGGVFTMDPDGGHMQRVSAWGSDPRWFGASDRELVVRRGDGVYLVSADGASSSTYVGTGGPADGDLRRRVAFADGYDAIRIEDLMCGRCQSQRSKIIRTLQGTRLGLGRIRWSPDGARIAVSVGCWGQGAGGGVVLLDPTDGQMWWLVTCSSYRYVDLGSWLPSGDSIVVYPLRR